MKLEIMKREKMSVELMQTKFNQWEYDDMIYCDELIEQIGDPILKIEEGIDKDDDDYDERSSIQYVRNNGVVYYINGKYEIHYEQIKKKLVDFYVEYCYKNKYYINCLFTDAKVCDLI
jgi:hypothetical protein